MSLDSIPVVPGANLLGHIHLFEGPDRLRFFQRIADTGELAQVSFLGRPVVFASSPASAHEVLVEKARHFEKSPGIRLLLHYLAGEGLFTSEGDLWRRQRRLMAPLFQPAVIAQYAACMHDVAVRAASTWQDGAALDLAHEMTRIAMGVVGKALFDSDTFDESDALGDALTVALRWADSQSASPRLVAQIALVDVLDKVGELAPGAFAGLRQRAQEALKEPLFLKGARGEKLQRAIRLLDGRIQQMIDERRAQGLGRADLLTRLLAARDEENAGAAGMTDKQVRDEANTLFVAGHETTATSLSWALYLLGRDPSVRAAVQREVDALPPGPISFASASAALPLTTRVFKESMRLYPPVPVYARRLLADAEIRGVPLPKGTLVFVNPYPIHRLAEVFPEPDRFDPDRFLPEREALRPKSAYIPFGAGPRVCIGMHFALLEGPIVLASLMRLVRFETDPARVIEPELVATLRPGGGVPARVYRRAPSPS
jgi:cytochrome P450